MKIDELKTEFNAQLKKQNEQIDNILTNKANKNELDALKKLVDQLTEVIEQQKTSLENQQNDIYQRFKEQTEEFNIMFEKLANKINNENEQKLKDVTNPIVNDFNELKKQLTELYNQITSMKSNLGEKVDQTKIDEIKKQIQEALNESLDEKVKALGEEINTQQKQELAKQIEEEGKRLTYDLAEVICNWGKCLSNINQMEFENFQKNIGNLAKQSEDGKCKKDKKGERGFSYF